MGSLDIDSLFTNIPLEETIEICSNNLFKNKDIVHVEFKDLLKQQRKSPILYLIIYYKKKFME